MSGDGRNEPAGVAVASSEGLSEHPELPPVGVTGRTSSRPVKPLRGLAARIAGWAARPVTAAATGVAAPETPTTRTCPYCATRIDLLHCDVVSTVDTADADGLTLGPDLLLAPDPLAPFEEDPAAFDDAAPVEGRGPAAGPAGRMHAYSVLVPGQPKTVAATTSLRDELFRRALPAARLVPVTAVAPPELMPRRVCVSCGHKLPVELDELDAHVLALVGVTNAGKTHYLAQALRGASKGRTLRRFGCTEFAATDADNTANVLYEDYFTQVSRDRPVLGATHRNEGPKHFIFTVTVNSHRFLLVMHDIAGEALTDSTYRATNLTFLRRADAVVFLLDPVEFDKVRRHLPEELSGLLRPGDQVHLLRQCLAELREAGRTQVPVSVAVSKADLLESFVGVRGPWRDQPGEDWPRDVKMISDAVRQVLEDLGEFEVLDLFASRSRVLFHAVSALGAPPRGGMLVEADPVRCEDPLGSALVAMTL